MSKFSKIRLVEIGGQVIIAPRQLPIAGVKQWFERIEGMEADAPKIIGFTDKMPESRKTYAAAIDEKTFDVSELPIFL